MDVGSTTVAQNQELQLQLEMLNGCVSGVADGLRRLSETFGDPIAPTTAPTTAPLTAPPGSVQGIVDAVAHTK